MTAQTAQNLKTRATQIRNETGGFANSETRVGSLFQDMVDSFAVPGVSVTGLIPTLSDAVTAAANTVTMAAAVAYANTIGGAVVVAPSGDFYFAQSLVDATCAISLTGTTGVAIKGAGRKQTRFHLANSQNCHVIAGNGYTWASVSDLEIDGNKANNAGGHGISSSIGSTVNYLTIQDCYIHDCGVDGVRTGGTVNYFIASGNLLENNGTYAGGGAGLSAAAANHFTFVNNIARLNYSHGIGVLGTATYGTITGNECHDNGQADPVGNTADGITGYNLNNRYVTISGNTCSGGNNHGIHWGGENFTITGNTIYNTLQSGIVAISSSAAVSKNVTITGNTIRNPSAHGIWLDHCDAFTVSGNSIRGAVLQGIWVDSTNLDGVISSNSVKGVGSHGILMNLATRVKVSGNVSNGNGGDGIKLTSCTDCSITDNDSTSNIAGSTHGILLTASTGTFVRSNRCKGNFYAIEETGACDSNIYTGNDFVGNTDDKPYLLGALNQWRDNRNGGTTTVASATALPAIVYSNTWSVSGTTTITSITGGNWADRIITLIFQGALTFTDGSNLKLAGNFVTTADDTITLRGDGTNWYEMSRSAN